MKGYIRKRGNTYSYTVDIGRDPVTGKRKQKTKGGFKTKKEAQEALNKVVYEVNKGTYILDSKSSMKEVTDEWFEQTKGKWKHTTQDTVKNTLRNWIIPHLGAYKVQELKPLHGAKFSKTLADNMVPSTARRVFSISKQILNFAESMEIISRNPFAQVPMPCDRKAEKTTWSFEDIRTFLKVAMLDDMFYHNVVSVAVFSGMRKGEIFGLMKKDVDFENNVIHVRRTLHETHDHGLTLGDPKTNASTRDILMDDNLAKALKDQIKRTNEYKLALGPDFHDHDLVFCRLDGLPYRPSAFNKPFNRLTKKAGVPQIRFHDLRHTHATLLLEIGVNHKVIAERLGHSDIRTTLNTYSHVTPIMQENAIKVFNQAFKAN